jgi:hypothetical protein
MSRDDDIPGQLADWGDVITATPDVGAPVTGPCMLDKSDEMKQEMQGAAGVIMKVVRARVQTSLFWFLEGGRTCNVNGTTYEVWQRLEEIDGTSLLVLRVE